MFFFDELQRLWRNFKSDPSFIDWKAQFTTKLFLNVYLSNIGKDNVILRPWNIMQISLFVFVAKSVTFIEKPRLKIINF